MANNLSFEKKVAVISMLCEGSSIRGIERITGIHRDTILGLSLRVGKGCRSIMDRKMQNLSIRNIQVDEMWGFVKAKRRTVRESKHLGPEAGDAWLWVALDVDTKLVPSYLVGRRDNISAELFISDLATRLTSRPQISSDALRAYKEAIRNSFGDNVDYGTVVKSFSQSDLLDGESIAHKRVIIGSPNVDLISTSFIEKQNHTVRMHVRRLARKTNAFSKRRDHLALAVALHYTYYNFCKTHSTLRCTPAMEAGVANTHWSIADILDMTGER